MRFRPPQMVFRDKPWSCFTATEWQTYILEWLSVQRKAGKKVKQTFFKCVSLIFTTDGENLFGVMVASDSISSCFVRNKQKSQKLCGDTLNVYLKGLKHCTSIKTNARIWCDTCIMATKQKEHMCLCCKSKPHHQTVNEIQQHAKEEIAPSSCNWGVKIFWLDKLQLNSERMWL